MNVKLGDVKAVLDLTTVEGLRRLYEDTKGKPLKSARADLAAVLPKWRRPCIIWEVPGGHYLIWGSTSCFHVDLNALRRQLSPADYAVVEALLTELKVQAPVAAVGVFVANAELATQRRRDVGARNGGSARRRPERSTVERSMKMQLRQGIDPRQFFDEWSEEYGYTKRHLGNILKAVQRKLANAIS